MAKGGVRIPILSEFKPQGIDKAIKEFQKLETTTQKIGFGLQKAFVPASAALAGLFAASVPMVRAASDLEEAQSKVNVVFGDSARLVEDFASTAATALGQSKQEVFDAAGVFGTFGKAAGLAGNDLATFTTDFIALASDLSSFNNTTPEQAIQAIGAALRGESEPLRAYGVLLDDASMRQKALELGITDTIKNALTPQQKILAAQALIFDQTADAQGDFARTSESLANSTKIVQAELANLSAEIGSMLLPIAKELVGQFRNIVSFVSQNQTVFIALAAAVALVSAAIVAANVAMKVYTGLQTAVKIANAVLGTSFKLTATQLVSFGTKLGVVSAVVSTAIIAYQVYTGRKEEARQTTLQLADALLAEGGAHKESLEALAANNDAVRRFLEAANSLGVGLQDVTQFIQTGTGSLSELVPAVEAVVHSIEGTNPELAALAKQFLGVQTESDDLRKAYSELTREQILSAVAIRDFVPEIRRLQGEHQKLASATELVTSVTNNASAAQSGMTGTTVSLDTGMDRLGSMLNAGTALMEEYEQSIRDANDALNTMIDSTLALFSADLQLESQLARTEEAIFDYASALASGSLTGRELAEAQREVREQAIRQAQAAVDAAAAQAELSGKTLEASERQRILVENLAQVADALDPADPLRRQLVEYIQQLGMIPSVVNTVITTRRVEILEQAIAFAPQAAAAAQQFSRMSRQVGGPIPGPTGRPMPIQAHGGEYVLSADVVDAIKHGRPSIGLGRGAAASGTTVVVNVAGSVMSERDLVESVRRGLLQSQRNGRVLVP